MTAANIQNLLTFLILLTTLIISIRTEIRSKRALTVDINFRALDKRKRLLAKIERSLLLFSDELDSLGYYYPLLKESEIYESYFEEENPAGPRSLDLGDVLRQKEAILPLLQEAVYMFPNAEKELKNLSNQLSKFVKAWHTHQDKKDFNKAQKVLKKTSENALKLMKKYLDIRQFPYLGY